MLLVFFSLGWETGFPARSSDMALGDPNPWWGLRPLQHFALEGLETCDFKCSQKVKMEAQSAEKLICRLKFHGTS